MRLFHKRHEADTFILCVLFPLPDAETLLCTRHNLRFNQTHAVLGKQRRCCSLWMFVRWQWGVRQEERCVPDWGTPLSFRLSINHPQTQIEGVGVAVVVWRGGLLFLWRPSCPVSKPSGIATGFLPQIKGAHLNFSVSSGDIEGPISLSICRWVTDAVCGLCGPLLLRACLCLADMDMCRGPSPGGGREEAAACPPTPWCQHTKSLWRDFHSGWGEPTFISNSFEEKRLWSDLWVYYTAFSYRWAFLLHRFASRSRIIHEKPCVRTADSIRDVNMTSFCPLFSLSQPLLHQLGPLNTDVYLCPNCLFLF